MLFQSDEEDLRPAMTANERELLMKMQKAVSGVYFEYGCGGSTFQAATMPNIKLVISVEGDHGWIEKLKTYKTVASATQEGRIAFIHVHYHANPKLWSQPSNKSLMENWPSYSRAIVSATVGPVPLIFIDGRFRVACALNALSRADENSRIMIHDYFRKEYHVVEKFYELVEQIDNLAVFRKRPDIDEWEVQSMLEKYEYNSA